MTQCTYSGLSVYFLWVIKKSEFGCGRVYIQLSGFQRECDVEMQPSCSVRALGTPYWTSCCNSHRLITQVIIQRRGFKSRGMFAKI